MQIRFFNDWTPEGGERLLIGLMTPDPDCGQAREAVRVATPEDVAQYPIPYDAYLDTFREQPAENSNEATTLPAGAARRDRRR
jgi:hypothetical protein